MKKLAIAFIMVFVMGSFMMNVNLISNNTVSAAGLNAIEASTTTITLGNTISVNGSGATVKGNVVTINSAGTYSVSGTLANGQIVINASKADVVLELAGVDITNSTGPAIYVEKAKTATITLKAGTTNNLTDGSTYSGSGLKAPLFSEDPMTINGTGTLNITAKYKHGIASDDSLTISGGNINIKSTITDGIHTNDNLTILAGKISINSSSDGIDSEASVIIKGGTLDISAKSDAIHADVDLTISGGTINVTASNEGLEGKNKLSITNGSIKLKSEDNAMTAGVDITISNGYVYIDSNNYGLNSKGTINVNGGTLIAFCGSSGKAPIKATGDFNVNGGTILATGGSTIATVSSSSKQYSMWIKTSFVANTIFNIASQSGSEIITFSAIKSGSLIFYSSDKLTANTTYNIKKGGSYNISPTNGIYTGGVYSGGTLLGSISMKSKSVSYTN